uniref:Protein kintoun n=1 Tax=Lutzomyia longipalpis TaxID=7200 RepID=A0A1B0GK77_LUTLO
MNRDKWEELDLSTDEIKSLTDALQKEEFRKLLVEYCQELNDPENKKKFEEELTQLEAERGIDVTFINPEPGYVVKTTVDGQMKGFINVCQSGKVQRPVSEYRAAANGERGLNWTLPHTQAPPRRDVDNKNTICMVYDVVFHPDALHLAAKNRRFRDILTDTACDAVETAFAVKLDRTNVKYPKVAFKGTPKPTVIRRKSDNPPVCEPSPLDAIYPPLANPNEDEPKVRVVPQCPKPSAYETPRYTITHRRDVDYEEFTHELDAKLNVTVPKELVIAVDLPLLKSTETVSLDVTRKRIVLLCEHPAKYKLDIVLPYEVEERQGAAKFDATSRRLSITLPVVKEHHLQLIDVTRQDSGVESMPHSPAASPTGSEGNDDVFEEKFLDASTPYTLPSFTCNTLDGAVAFTLNVKNVDPSSVHVKQDEMQVCVKFASIGGGFYPSHYAFVAKFPAGKILDAYAEAWDNNVVLQCDIQDLHLCDHYTVGLAEQFKNYPLKFPTLAVETGDPVIEDDSLRIEVRSFTAEEVEIDLKSDDNPPPEEPNEEVIEAEIAPSADAPKEPPPAQESKKGNAKKKNRKHRSLSESYCDMSSKAQTGSLNEERSVRKSRSLSESSGDEHGSPQIRFKSILKRSCSYNPSVSSSVDDPQFSVSVDLGVGSFDGIPEHQELSESCKKTVRFSDVIRKQLFRSNSSILGRRLKKHEKES